MLSASKHSSLFMPHTYTPMHFRQAHLRIIYIAKQVGLHSRLGATYLHLTPNTHIYKCDTTRTRITVKTRITVGNVKIKNN